MGLLILPLFVGVPIRVARELKTKLPVRLSGLLDAQKCLSYSRFFFGNHFFFSTTGIRNASGLSLAAWWGVQKNYPTRATGDRVLPVGHLRF